ncbi:MAG: Pycsar system effector family protein [Bacteroidota bacterium]
MSRERSTILTEAQIYAQQILKNQLPEKIVYHSFEHTRHVVEAALEIAINSEVSPEDMEIVELAAWFHDLGYTGTITNHEEKSVEIVLRFLKEQNYDQEKTEHVIACIRATKMPQNPTNKLEKIICDADLVHLANDKYLEISGLLQKEMEKIHGEEIKDEDWYKTNKAFIENHQFFTSYARDNYSEKVKKNLDIVKKKIERMSGEKDEDVKALEEKVKKLKRKLKEVNEIKPTRGIETMFRLTSKNHLDLSSMADTKANIMISVNSIILSVIVSVLMRRLEDYPHLTIPAIVLTIVCLTTIVFAILATRPNISKGTFTDEDIHNKKTNLLFFGNFHGMGMAKYEWAMKEMMQDGDYLYSSLIRDIYLLGVVLGKKYKLLRISYTIFMFGFVVSILLFVFAEVFLKAPVPY